MKTFNELIEESIGEIESKTKEPKQIFEEFLEILTKRHLKAMEQFDKQRLNEIRKLEDHLKTVKHTIYNIRVDAQNMSINLICEQLRRIAESISNCL